MYFFFHGLHLHFIKLHLIICINCSVKSINWLGTGLKNPAHLLRSAMTLSKIRSLAQALSFCLFFLSIDLMDLAFIMVQLQPAGKWIQIIKLSKMGQLLGDRCKLKTWNPGLGKFYCLCGFCLVAPFNSAMSFLY